MCVCVFVCVVICDDGVQVKAEIRHILLDSIGDRERKLRTTIV